MKSHSSALLVQNMHEPDHLRTRLTPLDLMVESGHLVPERPGRYDIRSFLLRDEKMWADDSGGSG
jgi:hypothetical protein